MTRQRLDQELVRRKLVQSRSQAENFIRLGKVVVNGRVVKKSGFAVTNDTAILLAAEERYVSRAGLKLASVATTLGLDFAGKIILDVGSSTGGFTDYALQHGAAKVYAVDVGTDQLHASLRPHPRIELYEKTDIRTVNTTLPNAPKLGEVPDIILIDVSFISIREILPHLATHIAGKHTQVIAMVKPQFEAGKQQVNKGVIKNDTIRRKILKDFETWVRQWFLIKNKADSEVSGAKGNRERFYELVL
ncbi:MAG TPA: TlyA family RNA methyltransferase [Verrucomicrobiae bacterium]|nr:TlyA family RNA methyltransferase [Verrucomicrobiae bacterium]